MTTSSITIHRVTCVPVNPVLHTLKFYSKLLNSSFCFCVSLQQSPRSEAHAARYDLSSSPALHKLQNTNYSKQWSVVLRSPCKCQRGSFKLGEDSWNRQCKYTALGTLFHYVVLSHIDTADCLKGISNTVLHCIIES